MLTAQFPRPRACRSHNKAFPRPIQGQLEVCGVGRRAPEAEWSAAEGVYFTE